MDISRISCEQKLFAKNIVSYFAEFHKHGGAVFRLDTRIYLLNGAVPGPNDRCIAAIIGKNPGSAKPTTFGCLAPLSLGGDKMLPSVRNRFVSAYGVAKKPIPVGAFIRVWNLFYLCGPKLATAVGCYRSIASPMLC